MKPDNVILFAPIWMCFSSSLLMWSFMTEGRTSQVFAILALMIGAFTMGALFASRPER